MRIALFGKYFNPDFFPYFKAIVDKFLSHNIDIVLYHRLKSFVVGNYDYLSNIDVFSHHKDIKESVDYLISIGGDGTFLDSISIVRDADIPIVGINSGRLGFLASISQDEIDAALDEIINNKYSIEKRDLLELLKPSDVFSDFNYALNDISVSKKDTSTMVKVHVTLDNEFLNTYWADGLIISTSTGSTAYSLSVGGPILIPENESFILSPISPHTLTVRPVVIPNNKTIGLELESRDEEFVISLDSQNASLKSGTKMLIKKADFQVKILTRNDTSFYKTLRNKLMWGNDKRN